MRSPFCTDGGMQTSRHTLYILQSVANPTRYYTGITDDLTARLAAHNAGLSPHTADGRPWRVVVAMEVADARKAADFET